MNSFYFSLEHSAWWLLLIFGVSLGLAWLFYSGKNIWNNRLTWLLKSLRFLSVFLILFLLLNPSITNVKSYKEKQTFPILIDNSQSAVMAGNTEAQLRSGIDQIFKILEDKGFKPELLVHERTAKTSDSITFNYPSSDISKLLYDGEESTFQKTNNPSILISDGIFNSGVSPVYKSFRNDIFCLGIGDTIARKDLILKSIENNSIAFLGNKFTIRADIQAIGYPNTAIEISLKNSKGLVEKKTISVKTDFYQESVDFIVPAETKGFQRYSIEISRSKGESNTQNNSQNAYVDIVDDRENILIVANAPHPNIKAIRSALLKAENINIEILIPGISEPKSKNFDLVILQNCLIGDIPESKNFIKENTSLLYIVGSGTDYGKLNLENGLVEISSRNQTDQAQAILNPSFSRFKIGEGTGTLMSDLLPIEVTFGEVRLKGGVDILLFQKINGVQTEKPLLVFGQTKRKTGALLTDGLWLWRMYEAQSTESSKNIDEIITKSIQYLSSKEDKRKFRIYSQQKVYFEGDQVQIETELYNDLYERINDGAFILSLSAENKKPKQVNFQSSEGNTALSLNSLTPGIYKIAGSTKSGGKALSANTEFVVKERKLEMLNLTADFQLLRELSNKNGGKFYSWSNLNQLLIDLDKFQAKAIWKSSEKTRELINEIWYFCLILAIISTEWIIRRYSGGY
ncbi:MAG: hypothetical protein H7329_05755 [Opitutaceae bacterium]|nr:hypothetical protein [Cytophagales bacterium]